MGFYDQPGDDSFDILNALSSRSFLSNLLGSGSVSTTPRPSPATPQPSSAPATAQGFDPGRVPGYLIDAQRGGVTAPPNPSPPPLGAPGGIGSDFAASGGAGPGAAPMNPPLPPDRPQMAVPVPPPRPQFAPPPGPMTPAAMPALPPNAAPTSGAVPPGVPDVPGTGAPGGGLATALGINPDRMRRALAAVGGGLTAVGKQPPGTFGATSFAAGAGGALEGALKSDDVQDEKRRRLRNDLFLQSSTAFKDMLAADESGDRRMLNKAHANYFAARAGEMSLGGGKGTNAWQSTPYGKVIQVENEAQKFEKGQQIILQKQWSLNGATADQQKSDLDALSKRVDGYRDRLYKTSGVEPKQAEKLKNMGLSQDNPFDTKGMTIEQFHQQVPMSGWFKDQNGVVRQRTVPPPGTGGQQPGPQAGMTLDDQAAMESAA